MTTNQPSDADSQELRELVAQSPTIARAIEERRLQLASDLAAGRTLTDLLQRSGPMWMKDANPQQIAAFARVCVALELNPLLGEAYLMHGTLYVGIAGRRKRAVQTGEYDGEGVPRLPTPEERVIYGVKDGDIARIVQVWRKGVRMPGEAVGIVRKGEYDAASQKRGPDGLPYAPIGRDPEGMAAKRGYAAAYKRVFGDLDLPTADMVQVGRRVTITDVDSGQQLLDAPASDAERPQYAEVGPVDIRTGEIIDQQPEPETPGEVPHEPTDEALAAAAALDEQRLAEERERALDSEQPGEPEPPPMPEKPGPRRRGETAEGRQLI